MPYEFSEWEHEPETQTSSSRGGGPPRKITGVGLLDPAVPPKRQGPLFPISATMFLRIFAAILPVSILVSMLHYFSHTTKLHFSGNGVNQDLGDYRMGDRPRANPPSQPLAVI